MEKDIKSLILKKIFTIFDKIDTNKFLTGESILPDKFSPKSTIDIFYEVDDDENNKVKYNNMGVILNKISNISEDNIYSLDITQKLDYSYEFNIVNYKNEMNDENGLKMIYSSNKYNDGNVDDLLKEFYSLIKDEDLSMIIPNIIGDKIEENYKRVDKLKLVIDFLYDVKKKYKKDKCFVNSMDGRVDINNDTILIDIYSENKYKIIDKKLMITSLVKPIYLEKLEFMIESTAVTFSYKGI